jgi:hypothetical protein
MRLIDVEFVNVDCFDWYEELRRYNKGYRRFFPRKVREHEKPRVTFDMLFSNGAVVRHTYKVEHILTRGGEPVLVVENGLNLVFIELDSNGVVKTDLVEEFHYGIIDDAKRFDTDYETIVDVFYL